MTSKYLPSRKIIVKTLSLVSVAAAVVALSAAAASAAEGGAEGATGMEWMWRTVDFALLAVLLGWVYFKHIKGILAKRIEGIEDALSEAKTAREEALARLADVEARLKDKDKEIEALVKVAEDNGVKQKARLADDGRKISEDILASARESIDAELAKAREAVRKEAAAMAVEIAEKMVRESINAEDRARIVQEYIAKVGG